MKTVEADIPEPVLKQAQELASRKNIPLRNLISLALTEAIGVWSNERSYVALRAKGSGREKFVDALKEVPDVPPAENDTLPENYNRPL